MPSFRTLLGRFTGNTVSTAAGFAAGGATQRTLDPVLQDVTNAAWEKHPSVPPDAYGLALAVAQGQVAPKQAEKWAAQQGLGSEQWAALVAAANVGPALGYAYEAWRRDFLSDDEFRTALNRQGLEAQWFEALMKLKTRVLDMGALAQGIHKSLIPDPGLLAVPQPQGEGKIPAYPQYPIDALAAALAHGYDRDALGVLVGLQGNPMGAHEAANAQFRGIIEPVDYDRAVAEGNTRNEWGDAIREQSRQIPTARDFLENALRGYSNLDDALRGAALHGMTEDHATLIYQNQGRPMTLRQITQAMAWGAKFNPEPGEITDPFEASTVEGSVKPGYYELFKALRYNLPSAFYFRLLQQSGVLTEDEAHTWYLRLGWPPELAAQIAKALAASDDTKADPNIKPQATALVTAARKAYTQTGVTREAAETALTAAGIEADTQAVILTLWDAMIAVENAPVRPTG